jgi:hypothetical protein
VGGSCWDHGCLACPLLQSWITGHPLPAALRSMDAGLQQNILTKITLSLFPMGAGS